MFDLVAKALQLTAESACEEFDQPQPVLGNLRWNSGVTRSYDQRSPLHLRYSIIGMDMSELSSLGFENDKLVPTASELLRYCSGTAAKVRFDHHESFHLPSVMMSYQSSLARERLFEVVILTLMVLARSHAMWFRAEHGSNPVQYTSVPVRLFDQIVPGTGRRWYEKQNRPGSCQRAVAAKIKSGKQHALTAEQEVQYQSLHDWLAQILRSSLRPPQFLPMDSHPRSEPSTVSPLETCARFTFVFLEGVFNSARRGEQGYVTREFGNELLQLAVQSLRNLLRFARGSFEVKKPPKLEAHQRAQSARPEPASRDPYSLRRWVLLRNLDGQHSCKNEDTLRGCWSVALFIIKHAYSTAPFIANFLGRLRDGSENAVVVPEILDFHHTWRREMLSYVQSAILGVVQSLADTFAREFTFEGLQIVPVLQNHRASIFASSKEETSTLRTRVTENFDFDRIGVYTMVYTQAHDDPQKTVAHMRRSAISLKALLHTPANGWVVTEADP